MKIRCTFSILASTIAVLAVPVAIVGAQAPTIRTSIQARGRSAADQQTGVQQPGGSNIAQGSTLPGLPPDTRPVVSLTLDDAVKLALDRNLTIAVQRLNPPQFDPALASLRATYYPQFTSVFGTQSTGVPPTAGTLGIPTGAASVTQSLTTFNGGLAQNVPVGGGQFALTLNNVKNSTTSTTALYNPAYLPTYTASFTQPLPPRLAGSRSQWR